MRKKKTFMGMAIIIAMLVLGVGYAAVNGVTLFVSGTSNIKANADFSVDFVTDHTIGVSSNAEVDWNDGKVKVVSGAYTDTQHATMTVYLDSTTRSVHAIYKIKNNSPELAANVATTISTPFGENHKDYFTAETKLYTDEECTQELATDTKLGPNAEIYLKVTVSLAKLPVNDISNATFEVTVNATPVENN